eukprot:COSAG06_NODE_26035_length_623_cov_0.982824_1_plen_207_part_11
MKNIEYAPDCHCLPPRLAALYVRPGCLRAGFCQRGGRCHQPLTSTETAIMRLTSKRGGGFVASAAALLAGALLALPSGAAGGPSSMEGFRPRIEAALEQYMSGAELMDCAYPNKRRWWQSLSAEGIEVVSTRNSPALFRAVRECMKLTEIEFGDVEASKAALTEFLVMRNAAESAAGTPRTESHAEKVMRVQREQREQESRSPPPPP